jgi:hypothetical protein
MGSSSKCSSASLAVHRLKLRLNAGVTVDSFLFRDAYRTAMSRPLHTLQPGVWRLVPGWKWTWHRLGKSIHAYPEPEFSVWNQPDGFAEK